MPVGDVVEPAAKRPLVAQESKPSLEVEVQRKVVGKTARPGRADEQLLLVEHTERVAVAPVERVGEVESLHERQPAPGLDAIRRVPGKRAARLLAEERAIEVEVQHGV